MKGGQTPMEFWALVERCGPDECWPWKAGRDKNGYGALRLGGRMVKAHRHAYELHHGTPPTSHVLHRCDNPPCCNPEHLFLGSQADNLADARSKGRAHVLPPLFGELNPRSKLTIELATEIRLRHRAGEGERALACAFGVARNAIHLLLVGRTWKTGGQP